jgi:hypothetical protein
VLATQPPKRILYGVMLLCLAMLTACGGHQDSSHGLVPWTDDTAEAAQLAQSTTYPACKVGALQLPRDEQQWGGVWNDAVSGYFMVQNAGRRACELSRPSRVAAATASGRRVSFVVGRLAARSVVLDPGDRAQVQVSSPYDCGRSLVRSRSFALAFPGGTLHVPDARMAVQCGGTLVDFSARTSGASGSGTASATPAARLRATMSHVPSSVDAGRTVTYAVTLTNPTSTAIPLDPCPSYQEGIKGDPSSVHTYQLNCGSVKQISPHSSVSFAMQLPLGSGLTPGDAVLDWKLQVAPGTVDGGGFASADTKLE